MADIVEVVDAGPGWTQVRDAEGNVFKLEGARNWRNNNPGNLEYGQFAQSLGAVGSDGRFAVFPSYESGRTAKETLLFESPRYQNLSLAEAINRYAPPNENNTSAYVNSVAKALQMPASTTMRDIPPAKRASLLDAMQRVEGFQVGRTYNAQGIPLPPGEIPNVVGTALSTVRTPTPVSPATMSPDLALMRNPIMSASANRSQPYASDLAMSGRPNRVTPTLTPLGAASYAPTDFTPTTTARGFGSLTPDARPAPYPQTMSPQVAAMRARDPNLQYELARRYPQVRLPELPPAGQPSYSQAMTQAARLAALRANQSQIERGPQLRPVGSSTQNIASQRAEQLGLRPANPNARLPMGVAAQNYDVGINGPAALTRPQYAALGNPVSGPRPLAPTPLMASAGLQSRRTMPNAPLAAMPAVATAAPLARPPQMAYAPAPQQTPLRVIVDGANYPNGISTGMTPVQSLQSQGYSPSQAYDLANKQSRDQARERAGLSTSSGSDWWDRVTGS